MELSIFDVLVFPPLNIEGFIIRVLYALLCAFQPKKGIVGNRYIGAIIGLCGGLVGFAIWLAYLSKVNNDWSILFGSESMAERKRRASWAVAILLIVGYLLYAFGQNYDFRSQQEKTEDALIHYHRGF